jgi:hypothetical protein
VGVGPIEAAAAVASVIWRFTPLGRVPPISLDILPPLPSLCAGVGHSEAIAILRIATNPAELPASL